MTICTTWQSKESTQSQEIHIVPQDIHSMLRTQDGIEAGDTAIPASISVENDAEKLHEQEDKYRIGVIATNQQRKEWGLAAAVCAGIAERLKGKVSFFWHSDTLIRHFSLPALIADFQLGEYVELTTPPMSDGEMAARLRECDLTLQVGSEGFGYGIFESLACGVRCLHGDYAGGASIMRTCGLEAYLVEPSDWRLEGQHNCLRPVHNPQRWVDQAMDVLENPPTQQDREWLADSVSHLSWLKLGHVWKRWAREGLGHEQ